MRRRVIRTMIVQMLAIAAVSFAGGYELHKPAPLRPCATEDSAGPCYWNATTQGNGRGHSFIVDANNHVTYLS